MTTDRPITAADAPDPVDLAAALIKRPSVTPKDAGALDVLADTLKPLGFTIHDLTFEEDGAAPVRNIYARWGDAAPHFCFAGHTDVVPEGDADAWRHPPYAATVKDGVLWGRGAADMKSAVAAFAAAAARVIGEGGVKGSVSLMITGDEEGEAINGTRKILRWLKERNETIDHCLVGEPTSVENLGDMMKVGRRGSMNCTLTVDGVQGHVAYPHRAHNPIPDLTRMLLRLSETPLDDGYERFQPSGLQITNITVDNEASNVIPAQATARFNIRFNPNWTPASLEAWLRDQLSAAIANRGDGVRFDLACRTSGEAFLTTDTAFIDQIATIIEEETGASPERSTSGGTSDARMIKDAAPVVEFGLVGASMHKTDEHAAVADIERLANIYTVILKRYFEAAPGSSQNQA
ncbi:MAG: succinyl-diaminopimelate desuccinylase [Pseudomonadota bacterium]